MAFIQSAAAVLLAFTLSSTAWAAGRLNVPSVSKVGQAVQAAGFDFQPGALLTVRMTHGNGQVVLSAVTADSQGRLTHDLVPAAKGPIKIEVMDAQGAVVTRAQMAVLP